MTAKKNPNLTKSEALKEAWKNKANYKGYDKSKGSMYNSWRAKVFTKKGRTVGFPEKWMTFEGFKDDMQEGWEFGKVLIRKDISLPYSKENCIWERKGTESLSKLIILEYNGESKTIAEWCKEYNLNYNGVRQRYFKGKRNFTPEEILFGRDKIKRKVKLTNLDIDDYKLRLKASKMASSYRLNDKKHGFVSEISTQYLYNCIKTGSCFYCGDTHNLGLDRIDNTKGHTIDNVVVCCYECNCARNDNFTVDEMVEIGKVIKLIKQRRNENNQQKRFDE